MTQTELPNLERKEMPKVDVKKYIGTTTKIDEVTMESGKHGFFLKVVGGVVETLGKGDNAVHIRASKILGLQTDGETGVPYIGADSKADRWLKSVGVEQPNELIGKELVMKTTDPNSNGQEFLTF